MGPIQRQLDVGDDLSICVLKLHPVKLSGHSFRERYRYRFGFFKFRFFKLEI